jgi:anti-anti-sigma regulatory factor
MTLTGLAHDTHRTRNRPRLVVSVFAEQDTTVILVDQMADVIAGRQGAVVIDLSDTDAIDTTCVRAIGQVAQWLAGNGRRLTIRAPSRLAIMLFATLGWADLVESDGEMPR